MKKLCLLCLAALLVCTACPGGLGGPDLDGPQSRDLLSGAYRSLGANEVAEDEEALLVLTGNGEVWQVATGTIANMEEMREIPLIRLADLFAADDLPFTQCAASSFSLLCVTRPGTRLEKENFVSRTGSFVIIVDYGVMELEKIR